MPWPRPDWATATTDLGSIKVTVKSGTAVDRSNGRLAGSTLTLDQAVRNLVDFARCSPVEEALAAASSVPASLLGLHDRGHLAVGNSEPTWFCSTSRLEVVATMVGGRLRLRAGRMGDDEPLGRDPVAGRSLLGRLADPDRKRPATISEWMSARTSHTS